MHAGLENNKFEDNLPSVSDIVYSFISGGARTQGDFHRKASKQAIYQQQQEQGPQPHFQAGRKQEGRGLHAITELSKGQTLFSDGTVPLTPLHLLKG